MLGHHKAEPPIWQSNISPSYRPSQGPSGRKANRPFGSSCKPGSQSSRTNPLKPKGSSMGSREASMETTPQWVPMSHMPYTSPRQLTSLSNGSTKHVSSSNMRHPNQTYQQPGQLERRSPGPVSLPSSCTSKNSIQWHRTNMPTKKPLDTCNAVNATSQCTSEPMRPSSQLSPIAAVLMKPTPNLMKPTLHIACGKRVRDQVQELWYPKPLG